MKLASIYLGVDAARMKHGVEGSDLMLDIYLSEMVVSFGGYTAWDAYGGWVSDSGTVYNGETVRIEVMLTCDHHEDQLRTLLRDMASDFYQECVMLLLTDTSGEMITGD